MLGPWRIHRGLLLALGALGGAPLALHACQGNPPSPSPSPGGTGVEAGALGVLLDPPRVTIAPGGAATVKVRVVRPGESQGTVSLSLSDSELSVPDVEIPPGTDVGELLVTAAPTAAVGTRSVKVRSLFRATSVETDLEVTIAVESGALDLTFADGGVLLFAPEPPDGLTALHGVVAADGGVLAAGEASTLSDGGALQPTLLMLDGAGKLERTFANGGVLQAHPGEYATLRAVTEAADGTVVAAGRTPDERVFVFNAGTGGVLTSNSFHTFGSAGSTGASVASGGGARYVGGRLDGGLRVWKLGNGARLDTSFVGTVPLPDGTQTGAVRALVVDDHSRVLAAASFLVPSGIAVARLSPTGAIDTTFGDGGVFRELVNGLPQISGLARQGGGWLLSGHAGPANQHDVVVVRVDADGHGLDAAFGRSGVVEIDVDGVDDLANGLAVDAQDRIYVVGERRAGATSEGFVLRLTAAGERDASFGKDGVVTIPPQGAGAVEAIDVLADGRLVVAGTIRTGSGAATAGFVARIHP